MKEYENYSVIKNNSDCFIYHRERLSKNDLMWKAGNFFVDKSVKIHCLIEITVADHQAFHVVLWTINYDIYCRYEWNFLFLFSKMIGNIIKTYWWYFVGTLEGHITDWTLKRVFLLVYCIFMSCKQITLINKLWVEIIYGDEYYAPLCELDYENIDCDHVCW